MGKWPLHRHVLHRYGDRVRLEVADPDGQIAWRGLLLEHDYPPVVGHIDADALDEDFDHCPLLLVRPYCMRWEWAVRKPARSAFIAWRLRRTQDGGRISSCATRSEVGDEAGGAGLV